ncbi:triose-phosphate isomerase [Patescibacteria group bacterium]|nr:triose-phosphate isomerase [Patescibacteria group bacterium]MBU1673171.1 triose-phosphate isomerase [Patescibacteria group bacterium]MBU1963328.1 triose-phosphate isomerase [Patescibacteria group bacterium]
MPKVIFAANWKMNKTRQEAEKFIQDFLKIKLKEDREVVICPPYTAIPALHPFLVDTDIKIGAQNMYWEDEGAYTGEISAKMLEDICVKYVIIGHSERRQYFGETDETVNKKVKKALEAGLKPIMCIGESLDEREADQTKGVIQRQLEAGLAGFEDYDNIILAYEPIWAIGTGKVATPEQAQEVHAQIREFVGKDTTIQYGGSVKPDNIVELMAKPDINGALVGGASLDPKDFSGIINY